ncbi:MAG: 50S ribosomal protein L13 [candidate division Zixibacteria bacterium]|nr:50S ribosomal protein L13 [candidate division Zixibacteria bacterium]
MKTLTLKIDSKDRKWFLVDLKDQVLGRAAVQIADILRGKNKPIFSPHLDNGDNIIVVNAANLRVTGNKMNQKKYYRYSGYPGGLKQRTMADMMNQQPTEVLVKAVRGMLPKNRLGRAQIKKLHVYAGEVHPHEAQKPEKLELK